MNTELLLMNSISKSFPGVKALNNVDFSLKHGEIHALLGENGAGKSTLMKILSGIYVQDEGTITVDGEQSIFSSPKVSEGLGIAMIHQELSLIKDLTVAENIFLGCEFTYGKTRIINRKVMDREAMRLLNYLNIGIGPNALINSLSVGEQQMVEIAKALSKQAKILILDEPTAALTIKEVKSLFKILVSLKKQGVGMVYVSHRMEEIFEISNRITVLRDGEYVATKNTKETNMQELVKLMVGRDIKDHYPVWTYSQAGKEKLRVEKLNVKGKLKDISFHVNSGEIVGIAGLMGAGRTELAKTLFGVEKVSKGRIWVNGKAVRISNPNAAIKLGITLVVEDRKDEGLILMSSCQENLILPNMDKISNSLFIKGKSSKELSDNAVDNLAIKTSSIKVEANTLSGGNQQKIVIGKWLARNPEILILDEPTRGVDVGAKKEIYDIIVELAEAGVAVILISSDLPEIIGMCNRVLVMHEGEIKGEFDSGLATQENIMLAATGGGSYGENSINLQ